MRWAIFISLSINSIIYSQCDKNPNWSRQIHKEVYRWYWDEDVSSVHFRGNSYWDITDKDSIKMIVNNSIEWAVNVWETAVNSKGPVITDMSQTTNRDSADFFIGFENLSNINGEFAGRTPDPHHIYLANQIYWTDIYEVAEANQAYDFKTVILHELGHLLVAATDHSVANNT